MCRTSRLWKGVGPLALGSLLLAGAVARADDPPPLPDQLAGLGQQALDQGRAADAANFFRRALKLDPNHAAARRALEGPLARLARQDPADAPPPAAAPAAPAAEEPPAAEGAQAERQRVLTQRQVVNTRERMQRARELLASGQPEAALNHLRLAQNAVQSDDQIPESVRAELSRELAAQIQATVRREEEIAATAAEQQRLAAATAQSQRALEQLATNQETVNTLMVQFDALMAAGQYNVLYNGGTGDIAAATAPFYDARILAQQARALDPGSTAPRAGVEVSQYEGFLAQSLAFEELKEYRFMLTLQDVERASVPFPDTITIEYPPAEFFRAVTERRTKKYESVSLDSRDAKTQAIMNKLDQPVSMPFPNDTPLEDVIKYIKTATVSPALPEGIPIYVDPIGLQESEKTEQSPVKLNLEGVPLKRSLKLMLNQLNLTYTVKDGLMTITSKEAKDQPTEIRVYPVADLAIIPISLLGGGGGMMGGGMGGMGGMGGGMMGGMGGGMGGMGGGMGGMGMGGMGGGFMSVPLGPPQDDPAGAYTAKKKS
jgi:tetratricopeptide (TPR) repeat protein